MKLFSHKKRSASSKRWLSRQLRDGYVAKAKAQGYRSRAAYKLLEIQEKFKLFCPNMNVVDLGSSPGGWTQVAVELVKSDAEFARNQVIAIDILQMELVHGAVILQKDFFEPDAPDIIKSYLKKGADIVISDMAPNTTGHRQTDHLRIMALCEQAIQFGLSVIKPGGHFVTKIFCGGMESELLGVIKQNFGAVYHFKPKASRKESRELYLIAMNRKNS